jgi:membrane associated rhomboid family serine protease
MIRRYGNEGSGFSFGPGPMTRAVKQLLIANVVVFLATQVIPLPWTETFGLVPRAIVSRLWIWQFGTYLFLHGGFMHIIMNMFALWMFGVPLEREWGYREFMKFYLVTGIGAGIVTFLFMLGSGGATIGASGATMALLVAFAMLYPDTPILLGFFLPIPARVFVLIYAVIEFLNARSYSGDGIGHVTHLGGMAIAFAFLKLDWRPGAGWNRWKRKLTARARGLRVVDPPARTSRSGGWRRHEPPPERRADAEVDAILDKISREGMQSLTEDEMKKLRERSQLGH